MIDKQFTEFIKILDESGIKKRRWTEDMLKEFLNIRCNRFTIELDEMKKKFTALDEKKIRRILSQK